MVVALLCLLALGWSPRNAGCPPVTPTAYYVATTGSDSNPGTSGSPFATVARAQAATRSAGISGGRCLSSDFYIHVAAGTYWGTAFALTDADSGYDAGGQIHYVCDGSAGSCILSGGQLVTGWATYSGSISRAPVTSCPWTMRENTTRGRLARSPNFVLDASFPEAQGPYFTSTAPTSGYQTMGYTGSDLPALGSYTVGDLRVLFWDGISSAWYTSSVRVASVDTTGHTFTFVDHVKYNAIYWVTLPRYLLQGDLALLDQAREWYCDRNDVHGAAPGGQHYLYYWPGDGAIGSQSIVIPTTQEVIDIHGSSASATAKFITFDGFTVEDSDFSSDGTYAYGYYGSNPVTCPGYDGDPAACDGSLTGQTCLSWTPERTQPKYRHGAIRLQNTDHVTIRRSIVQLAGFHGIYAFEWNQYDVFDTLLVQHSGEDGIKLEGSWPCQIDMNNHNRISNSKITISGELVGQGGSVYLAHSDNDIITHNELSHTARSGIFMVGTYGLPNPDQTYGSGTTVSFNNIHDVGEDSGDIGACIATFSFSSPTTKVNASNADNVNTFSQNICDKANAVSGFAGTGPSGIFPDNQTSGQVYTNINVTNTTTPLSIAGDTGRLTFTNVVGATTFDPTKMDNAGIGVPSWFPF